MAANTARLDQLIKAGEKVLDSEYSSGISYVSQYVVQETFEQWRISCLSFIDREYSRNSHYYQEFIERCSVARPEEARSGLATLRAIKDDIESEGEPSATSVGVSDLPLHPRISGVSTDLYEDGHYAEAVLEASKALINFVKEKSRTELDGAPLMTKVFSKNDPILAFNALSNQSETDEQQGMMHLFQGAVLAIRNPRGHDFLDDTAERAMEYISFISMLANLVEESRRV